MVLDMIMDPGIDGLETYHRIVDIVPRQKAIIVSGSSLAEEAGFRPSWSPLLFGSLHICASINLAITAVLTSWL